MEESFLPVTRQEALDRGWEELDFVIVAGDAYVDHPSFGTAIISRYLEAKGYRVGIIPQPDWTSDRDFKALGQPKYAFFVTAGNVDSMVNHYTSAKKRRKKDVYSPGGKGFQRPDRASIVYTNRLKGIYRDTPIILGGIEASLRRLGHYDYWDDTVRRSLLLDSKADMIIYGMGEKTVLEVAESLEAGIPMEYLTYLKGTVVKSDSLDSVKDFLRLPSFVEIAEDKELYGKSFLLQYQNTDPINGKTLVEDYDGIFVIQNPPRESLEKEEFDQIYRLPFTRRAHPRYDSEGGIPALNEVKFSIISNRGCYGGCSFCALTFHQGRRVQSRSKESILDEGRMITEMKDFKGYIHDVGGPTANFQAPACKQQLKYGVCKTRQCLHPSPCKELVVDHQEYLNTLRELRSLPEVKKVFVRSGLRYDYLMLDENRSFFRELVRHHISGQLKVAPEHVSSRVLEKMGKPKFSIYQEFKTAYDRENQKAGMDQYLVPYFISGHPGSRLEDAIELAEYIRDLGTMPEQVQDFYPTPGTLSTCMYYTGIDPRSGEAVYVPKSREEKAMQRALIQFRHPRNRSLVRKALIKANRRDLMGKHRKALIPE